VTDAPESPEDEAPGAATPEAVTRAGDVLPEPAKKSRAGRNLPAAIAVGLGLAIGLVLIPIYLAPNLFVAIVAVASVVGVRELQVAFGTTDIRVPFVPLAAGSLAMVLGAALADVRGLLVAYALTVVLLLLWRLSGPVEGYLRDSAAAVFVASYLSLMISFAVLMVLQPEGADRILVFILTAVCSDVGGYAAGVLFGKHPMSPRISPKKSWEGFAGSVTLQVVLGAALFVTLLESDWWKGAIVGAIMTVTATLGDFVESAMKRDLGIKDMSNLLPGHGGLMDRLDSIIPNTVVAYTLFAIFLGGV
jgi:phosphatidate cytidylyltransferase